MSCKISEQAKIGANFKHGENVVIEADVIIGDNVEIGHNVVVRENVHIGDNCKILDGAILGKMPAKASMSATTGAARELPSLEIGKAVTVGAGCVIYRGDKRVEQYGFFDSGNHVYVSGAPVSVISAAAAAYVVDGSELKESVKVRTVTGEKCMKIFTADKIEIYNGEEAHTINCVKIGISPRGISRAVLHPDLDTWQ